MIKGGIKASDLFSQIRGEPDYAEAIEDRREELVLARNLLRLRVDCGYTQEELATRASMRQPRVAEIEAAKGNVGFQTLKRIARALDVSLRDLVDEPDIEDRAAAATVSVPLVTAAHVQD